MIKKKISLDIFVMIISFICLLFCLFLFGRINSIKQLKYLGYLVVVVSLGLIFILYSVFRKMFVSYCNKVSDHIDLLIDGKIPEVNIEEDTLTSKIDMKLGKLFDVIYANVTSNEKQKQEIQKMVSDITHQLKTPIANITMYSSMIEDNELSEDETKQFLSVIHNQVSKLEFLIESLQKMARLESSMISIDIQPTRIADTIIQAVSQAEAVAQKKNINIDIQCDDNIILPHDTKGTAEALFNIIDNALKYTNPGGNISISIDPWEIYTRIDIKDNGIGIKQEHINDIFKRFYREGKVHKIEGVGIGLYLSRQIISAQGGYIKVTSKENVGSTFSVFLPNSNNRHE